MQKLYSSILCSRTQMTVFAHVGEFCLVLPTFLFICRLFVCKWGISCLFIAMKTAFSGLCDVLYFLRFSKATFSFPPNNFTWLWDIASSQLHPGWMLNTNPVWIFAETNWRTIDNPLCVLPVVSCQLGFLSWRLWNKMTNAMYFKCSYVYVN